MIGGPSGLIFQSMLIAPFLTPFSAQQMGILAHNPNKGLEDLNLFFEQGKLKPHIDSEFPFEQLPEAFTYFGKNEFCGKIVIKL